MDNKKKVPLMNKLAYGIGTGGGCVFNQIAAAFLLNYYTDTALIGAGAIATMFLVCRIFDGVTDFVMGGIIDKTSSRLGKARPWLIASAPLTLIGIVLLMNVPMGLSDGGKLVYAYLTYIFMNCIVYTIYGISNTALLPLMTRDKDDSTMGAGPLLSAVFALVPDVVEYGNWKYGIRSEGLISSAQSIGSKIGIGIGSALTGWILAAVGYNPMAEPTEAVINAVKFDFTWMGVIIGVVILVIVLLLNVEKYSDQYNAR